MSDIVPETSAADADSQVQTCRRSLRVPYTCDRIEIDIEHGGQEVSLIATGRNISKGGLGVLVNREIPSDTRCTLRFPRLTGQICTMPARIDRCKPVHGELHEAGIVFDQPIDLEAFVTLQRVQRMIYMKEKKADAQLEAAAALKQASGETAPAPTAPKPVGPVIVSKLIGQPGMAEKLEVYLQQLGERSEQLSKALADRDTPTMLDHALWLAETAQPHGFPTLSAVANAVSAYLEDEDDDLSTTHAQVQQLINYMKRAEAKS